MPSESPLTSTDHLEIAHTLKEMALQAIRSPGQQLGGKPVKDGKAIAKALDAAIKPVWQKPASNLLQTSDTHISKDLFQSVMNQLNAEQKTEFIEGFARLG